MNKKLASILLSTPVIVAPAITCIGVTTSCHDSEDINIEDIALYPDLDYIRPGEIKIVRAVALPDHQRITDLDWTLVDCPYPEISIDSEGWVAVDQSLQVGAQPIVVQIKATLLSNSEVSNTTQITVLPKPSHDFQGFLNNEIQFLGNRTNEEGEREIKSVQLTQLDEKTYVTSQNIDVFQFDDPDLPEGWTSLINFTPLVGGGKPNFMSFTIDGGDYVTHSIEWDIEGGYDDSAWTDTIPAIFTYNDTNIFDKIIVRFSCDPDVRLEINLTSWQAPWLQSSPGIYSFIPSSEEQQPNPINYVEDGVYKLSIPCPATSKHGIITKTLDSVYAYRTKFEYTDFTFEFEPSSYLEDIEEMFVYAKSSEPKLIERPFDKLRAYQFILSYQIDLSLRQHTYEDFDYSDVWIGTLYAMDPSAGGSAANLEIWITWEK